MNRVLRFGSALLLTGFPCAALLLGGPSARAEVGARLIVDPVQTDGFVYDNLVTGLQPGDQVSLRIEVDNGAGDAVLSLFTVAGFDPAVVVFDTGATDAFILDEGGFGGNLLGALLQPELRFGQSDETIVLSHATTGAPSNASTTGDVGDITFKIAGQDVASAIRHEISIYDVSIVNGIVNDTNATPTLDLGSPVVLAVPEPGVPSLAAIGALALAGLERVRRRRA